MSEAYPQKCDLCNHMIESSDDAMWWHGYGNCVEITDEMWAQWEKEAALDRDSKGNNILSESEDSSDDEGEGWRPDHPVVLFLSGLPDRERRRRVLVPLQGFIDDSQGGKGERRMFVLAGLVNEAQWWVRFSDDWAQWCRVHPSLPYLKMDELDSLGWGVDAIKQKLQGFIEIIKTPPFPKLTYISLDLDKFEAWRHKLVPPANDWFYIPALFSLLSVGHEQAKREPN